MKNFHNFLIDGGGVVAGCPDVGSGAGKDNDKFVCRKWDMPASLGILCIMAPIVEGLSASRSLGLASLNAPSVEALSASWLQGPANNLFDVLRTVKLCLAFLEQAGIFVKAEQDS